MIVSAHHGSRAGPYSSNRLFEYITGGMLLGIAFILIMPGDTLDSDTLAPLAAYGLDETKLALIGAAMGVLRLGALLANGRIHPHGAIARYVGSMVGASVWLTMLALLVLNGWTLGRLAISTAVYALLLVGELISLYAAVRDGGFRLRTV